MQPIITGTQRTPSFVLLALTLHVESMFSTWALVLIKQFKERMRQKEQVMMVMMALRLESGLTDGFLLLALEKIWLMGSTKTQTASKSLFNSLLMMVCLAEDIESTSLESRGRTQVLRVVAMGITEMCVVYSTQ